MTERGQIAGAGHRRVQRVELVSMAVHGDERGSLIAIEGGRDLPFAIERVYYIFGTSSGVARGRHAHRDLSQLLVCVSGACTVSVDDGTASARHRLGAPDRGLIIGDMVWREMSEFTPDAVLLVLASRHHTPSDYIRDHAEFRTLAGAAR